MSISPWRSPMNRWLATHHGVITRQQLSAYGCSTASLAAMLDRGELITVASGAFRSAQYPAGTEQLMGAVCQRHSGALVAFLNACAEWRFRRAPRADGLHILVVHGSSPEIPGVIVHRCRRIDAVDVVERDDGIRLTSPPRTLFDSADMLGLSATTSILEQILNDQRCTFGTIADTVHRLARPRRPGTKTMLAVLRSRPAWRAALQSDQEQRVFEAIARAGLPAPITQCPVLLPTGRTIHLDFGWPDVKVGLEVDHAAWHAAAERAHHDKYRDRKAGMVGWFVPRITDLDVHHGLADAIADVAEIIRLRDRGG